MSFRTEVIDEQSNVLVTQRLKGVKNVIVTRVTRVTVQP